MNMSCSAPGSPAGSTRGLRQWDATLHVTNEQVRHCLACQHRKQRYLLWRKGRVRQEAADLQGDDFDRGDTKQPRVEANVALKNEQLPLQEQPPPLERARELVAHQLRVAV